MVRSHLNPALGPPLPRDQWATSLGQIVREFLLGIVPLAVVILAALGSILVGLATPTEAAAMGASRALLLVIGYGRFSLRKIKDACLNTLETSSLVLFLAVASNIYGAVFTRLGTSTMIAEGLVDLGPPPAGMLVLLMGVIFLLGWPLEWPPSSSFPADLPAGGAGDRDRPPVVQRAGRGQSADGVPPAAGGDGGLLSEGRRTAMGARLDVSGHAGLHAPAVDRAHRGVPVSSGCALAS